MKPATTIAKVCRVLGEFKTRSSMGVTDIARRAELLPSDVHRILSSLEVYGYIEQDQHTRRYHLGSALLRLGLATLQRTELREAGRPLLKRLAEQIGATTHMAIFDSRELEVFLVEQIDSPGEVLIKPRFGFPAAPHSTALGKTIMASMDHRISDCVVRNSGLIKCTKHTITDSSALEAEFVRIRDQGYGVDREESMQGACCLGAPVRDDTGAVIASISASMRADRFYQWHEARLAYLVKSTAAELSAAIGYGRDRSSQSTAPLGTPRYTQSRTNEH